MSKESNNDVILIHKKQIDKTIPTDQKRMTPTKHCNDFKDTTGHPSPNRTRQVSISFPHDQPLSKGGKTNTIVNSLDFPDVFMPIL